MAQSMQKEQQVFDELYKSVQQNGKLMFAGRLLQRAAKQHGDRIAIIYQDQKLSYQALYARACALSKKLVERFHLKPRDKALICFENCLQFYIAYFALW